MSTSSYCNEAEVFSCSDLLDYCDLRFPDEDLNGSADPTPQSTLKAGLDGGTRKRYPFAKKKVCHLGFKTLQILVLGFSELFLLTVDVYVLLQCLLHFTLNLLKVPLCPVVTLEPQNTMGDTGILHYQMCQM